MTFDMLVKMDMEGKVLAGRLKPSSEVKMHLRVYKENPEVLAVTHAHPPIATSFAIAGISLDRAILPEAVVNLGSVPIAHYATPGSTDVPDSIAPYCKTHNAVLLANHGALSWGKDVLEAYHRLESLEYYATVLMYTGRVIGQANELSCTQVEELIAIREKLGITAGGMPPCAAFATNTQDIVSSKAPLMHVVPQIRGENLKPKTDYEQAGCGCKRPVANKKDTDKEALINELSKRITEEVLERLKG